MSGIYIPGVDAPRDCAACPAVTCYWRCDRISKHCPIIPVPAHGDLIDRDEYRAMLPNIETEYQYARKLLDEQPPIIPADKEATP